MEFVTHVLRLEGAVNGIYSVIPQITRPGKARESDDKLAELIKAELRRDQEENLYGPGIPKTNPSKDPSEVTFMYNPTKARQRLYANGFPIHMGTYAIIDAFTCLGSRFGLKQLGVFVELCRSDMGNTRYWANIYYIADSEIPVATIHVDGWTQGFNDEELLEAIEEDRRYHQKFVPKFEKSFEEIYQQLSTSR